MNILIAIDFSENSRKLLDKAIKLLHGALGEVWMLHVAEPDPEFVGYEIDPTVMRDQVAIKFHGEHRQMQEMAEELRGKGINAKALLVQGETVKTITEQSEKLNVDMLVVGSHEHGALYHFLLGNVSQGVLKESGRPVLMIPLRSDSSVNE